MRFRSPRNYEACVPTRGAAAGGRLDLVDVDVDAAAVEQPGDDRVGVPHLAGSEFSRMMLETLSREDAGEFVGYGYPLVASMRILATLARGVEVREKGSCLAGDGRGCLRVRRAVDWEAACV